MGPGEPECFCHRINISAFLGSTVFSFGVRRAKMKEKELLNTAGHGDCRLQGWVGSPEMAKRRLCYSQCYTRRQIIQSSSRAFQSLPLKGHPPDNLRRHEGYVYTMGIHSKKENTLFSYCRQGKWLKVHQWEQYSRINCMIYSICPIHFCFPLPIFYPFLLSLTPVPSILWRRMSTEQSHLQRLVLISEIGVTSGSQAAQRILVMPVLALSSSPRAGQVDEFQGHSEHSSGFSQNYNVSPAYSLPSLLFFTQDR